jgi:hypothetical protein
MNLGFMGVCPVFITLYIKTRVFCFMNMKKGVISASLVALIALFAISALAHPASAFTAPPTPWTQCPAVGFDTSCAILIVINPDGTVSIYQDATQGTYDGIEDTLVGVQDNCSACSGVGSISLSGSNIFGFDGDGPCAGPLNNVGFPAPYPPVADCPGGAYTTADPTDYETNNVTFTITDTDTGTANFGPALTSGSHAWFGLEEQLTATSVTVTTISTTSVSTTSSTTTQVGVPQFSMPTVFAAAAAFVLLSILLRSKKQSLPSMGPRA